MENYQPVSLLLFQLSGLQKQVTEFQNILLDPNLSCFKSGNSTETAILSVTEALKEAVKVLILLGLSVLTLLILSNMGITAHSWFGSYFTLVHCVLVHTTLGTPKAWYWGPSTVPCTPPLWARSCAYIDSHITAMQIMPNSICPS